MIVFRKKSNYERALALIGMLYVVQWFINLTVLPRVHPMSPMRTFLITVIAYFAGVLIQKLLTKPIDKE